MSTTRFRMSLAILACLVLGVAGVLAARTLLADHDGWSIIRPVKLEAEPLIIEPDDLLAKRDRESIRQVVEEARSYGIPWSVAVFSDATLEPGVAPEEMARDLLDDRSIESRPGADDGLLMFVLIPQDDHTATQVHFVTGENFYPRGGITPERLQWIADVQMAPLIERNTIGDAVIEGATWVEWMQLFMPKPDPPATNLQEGLKGILDPLGTFALVALTLVLAGGAIAITLLTRRGTGPVSADAEAGLDPISAAALADGRVNHRSIAGMILDALDRGVLIETAGGLMASPPNELLGDGDHDGAIRQAVSRLTDDGVFVTPGRLARHLRVTPITRRLEDDLANAGYLHPRSYRFQLMLRGASIAGALVGLISLVLSVAGEVESSLAAGIALTAVSVVVLIWNEFRSWATDSGIAALETWLSYHQRPDDRDRLLFETIRRLDEVPDAVTNRSDRSSLLASLRYQG